MQSYFLTSIYEVLLRFQKSTQYFLKSLFQSWFDFLHTRRIVLTYDYKWHPIYPPYQTDLPTRVTATEAQCPKHPFELEPDSAHIEVSHFSYII